MLSASPRIVSDIPRVFSTFLTSSLLRFGKLLEIAFTKVFLRCPKAAFIILKNCFSFETSTLFLSSISRQTTADSTFGAGTNAPAGTVNLIAASA